MQRHKSFIAACVAAAMVCAPLATIGTSLAQSTSTQTPPQPTATTPDGATAPEPAKDEKKKKRSWRDLVPAGVGVVGAVGGALLCNQIGRQTGMSDSQRASLMVQCAALAGAGGFVLGNQLKRHLVAQDQLKMVSAMRKSIRTGEPQSLELPDSGALAEISSGAASREVRQAKLEYDPASVEQMPTPLLVVLDQAYVSTTPQQVRSGPEATFKVVSTQPANTPLHVIGKIQGTEWLLVGVENVAVGYVLGGPRLKATETAVPAGTRPATTETVDVQADLPCRAMEVDVDFSAEYKQDVEQQNRFCTEPNGATVLALAT